MTITYPLALPSTPAPQNATWTPVAAAAIFASPFTMQQQVQVHQGMLWRVQFSLPRMNDPEAEEWVALKLALNGMEGTFHFGDSVRTTPRGSGGSPLVNGASQTGRSLITDGWPASTNGVLLKGDWIQLGSGAARRIYKTLLDVNSDAGGNATIDIWPRLRESPADNEALILSNTKGTFRLANNEMDWTTDRAKQFGIEVDAVEAF